MRLTTFKEFMQMGDGMEEEKRDIKKTLSRLPPSHRALVDGFKWKFHAGNTLNGDDEHVGYMDDGQKEIAVAGPWNYGREFTVLHEVAHKVWERMPPALQKQWHHVVANTKNKHNQSLDQDAAESLDQSPEELFCMVYATVYAKHKLLTYSNPEWMNFIKRLPK